nr:MAG TPA: hypothetical protein [Caudoviricetes sp.]
MKFQSSNVLSIVTMVTPRLIKIIIKGSPDNSHQCQMHDTLGSLI